MLHLSQLSQSKNKAQSPLERFKVACDKEPQQVFVQKPIDINRFLQTNPVFEALSEKTLTFQELWNGEVEKGKNPAKYTNAIIASAVIEGSQKKTEYGETYERISIQPEWLTGTLAIVKEEVHQIDAEHKMIFFGIPFDIQEVKKYLVDALLREHFEDHSLKTKYLLKNFSDKFSAKAYLDDHFEELFNSYQPPLFHVAHGVEGSENHPIETWMLVRIAAFPQNTFEAQKLSELREKIENGSNIPLYLRSLEAKAPAKSSCGM